MVGEMTFGYLCLDLIDAQQYRENQPNTKLIVTVFLNSQPSPPSTPPPLSPPLSLPGPLIPVHFHLYLDLSLL